jgi:hypothetical protein
MNRTSSVPFPRFPIYLCFGQSKEVTTEAASRTVEDGGTGPFPALMASDSTLATHTVFRSRDHLEKLHTPVIYILSGEKDIAYQNGMDDFRRINRVPVFMANLNVGHGGTYAQPHGGEFAKVATAWFQWQLKGDKQAAAMFEGDPCGIANMPGWKVEKKNIR